MGFGFGSQRPAMTRSCGYTACLQSVERRKKCRSWRGTGGQQQGLFGLPRETLGSKEGKLRLLRVSTF